MTELPAVVDADWLAAQPRRRRSPARRRPRAERAHARPYRRLDPADDRHARPVHGPRGARGVRGRGCAAPAASRRHGRGAARALRRRRLRATRPLRCRSRSWAATSGWPCWPAAWPSWPGELETGVVELEKSRAELTPFPDAVAGLWEPWPGTTIRECSIVDVRREDEFSGKGGYPCDPRQGHIPGARNVEVSTLFAAPGVPKPAEEVRALVGAERTGGAVVDVLPLGLALGPGRGRAPRCRLRREELRRLVARVVAPRRAPARALGQQPARRPRGTRRRASGRDASHSSIRCVRLREQLVGRARQLLGRLGDPARDDLARHLGVELDAPGGARRAGTPAGRRGSAPARAPPAGTSKRVEVPLEGRRTARAARRAPDRPPPPR